MTVFKAQYNRMLTTLNSISIDPLDPSQSIHKLFSQWFIEY